MSAGYLRADGRVGIRNHVLVLPSVVCSTHAAMEIARDGDDAIAITHQHGCLHVGDDLTHTEDELIGTATNPNVGGVVVVSLGCETIQGRRLARRIAQRDQRVAFVGIQQAGGTARAIEEGRAEVARMRELLDADARTPLDAGALAVGIDRADHALVAPLREVFDARGWRTLLADPELSGAEAHVSLAGQGAQAIVSLRGAQEAPIGFATCPVIAVAGDPELYAALHDDFDLDAGDDAPAALAERIAERVAAVADGERTASERRGARDFVLRRLAVTM
ncbi:UxaA family hydrolase [Conexibacter sp. CPCC 206217]|uniref:UxaA family hydrolase n=1 Tax=Conexibacter sp. CPCC 206217 TaxID=3064574 RepID=UPI0027234857|nr:UxaA family hydrolase [Conexibacter sp. CPCC 206217]MDO8211152.1 UxaA family hydrolase [Conexibacter sp. CPCC 206217]